MVAHNRGLLFEKVFERDFCLPLIEIWCKGETHLEKPWVEGRDKYFPYLVFERSEGTVKCYMCTQGIGWLKKKLNQFSNQEKDFSLFIVKEFLSRVSHFKPLLAKPRALNYKALKTFLGDLQKMWPWLEALWWLIESSENPNSIAFKKLMEAREVTQDLGIAGDCVIRKSLGNSFPLLGDLSAALLIEEIRTKRVPTKTELKNRMDGYFYTNGTLYTGRKRKDVEKIFHILIGKRHSVKSKQIKGNVAFAGKAGGRVRVIKSAMALRFFKKGEILVTPMTTPNYILAMKKAAGIITDEGGITCHAAIVSRELGIPCIIGTKVATQVLKDGDQVEVDAERGVVKIIQS